MALFDCRICGGDHPTAVCLPEAESMKQSEEDMDIPWYHPDPACEFCGRVHSSINCNRPTLDGPRVEYTDDLPF